MRTRWISMFAFVLLLLAGNSTAQSFKFVSIDVPNATFTVATGISPGGAIVGIYGDASFNEHGFLLKDGHFTTVDVPSSLVGVSGTLQTEVNGINAKGDIVGDYFAPPGAPGAPACTAWNADGSPKPECIRGFLFRHGEFSDVLVPGHPGSIPNSITSNGSIYGCLHDFDLMASMFGFARLPAGDGGGQEGDSAEFRYISLLAGGGELIDPAEQVPDSMNNGATPNGKTIVGLYTDMNTMHTHGYIVRNGKFYTYDVPGSLATTVWGINPDRDFVGVYRSADNNRHGFLQRWDASAPISIDYPGALRTAAYGINPAGAIVGDYIDANGNDHGFLAVFAGDDNAN